MKGIGDSKASKLIEARDQGTLTDKQKEDIEKASNAFYDIFPFHNNYSHLYENPQDNGIASPVIEIKDLENIPHREERVFLGEMIYKNARNYNEEVNVKKRGGKIGYGPLEFVDVRLRDDSGQIGGRIGRFDFERCGRELLERVPEGAQLLVRAKFFNDIRFAFITKWKRIDAREQ